MISLRKTNSFVFLNEANFDLELGLRSQVDSKDVK